MSTVIIMVVDCYRLGPPCSDAVSGVKELTRPPAWPRGDPTEVDSSGEAHRNPRDVHVPEIGDEIAAARALLHLVDRLLGVASADIEAVESNDRAGAWSSTRSAGPVLVAESVGEALLVVGTRELVGIGRLVSGSVSHHCVSHAQCPVSRFQR